jgi:site-specific DNA-methyltransferase (adenine-specific)
MKTLPENSVDSIVTDPPYELGFMGKSWDNSGVANSVEMWSEVLRVLKPGGHLLAFSGSRTYHRMVCAIEDAGFEIRDQIMWIYGSGFPKSHNIDKAIDKAAGAEREVVKTGFAYGISVGQEAQGYRPADYESKQLSNEAITDEAKQWQGWGTALKPAHEPIVMARKPLIGTVAENVLEHNVGGLNIDGCRIAHKNEADRQSATPQGKVTVNQVGNMPDVENKGRKELDRPDNSKGRWPANIIFDEQAADLLDEQTNHLHAAGNKKDIAVGLDQGYEASSYQMSYKGRANRTHNDSGGASRFFYCSKASKRDRNEGLEDFETKQRDESRKVGNPGGDNPRNRGVNPIQNFHPTVKPTSLMRYLLRLVTPKGGVVLDPFMGSGSTGKACVYEGFNFIGIDQDLDYVGIAKTRIQFAKDIKDSELPLF